MERKNTILAVVLLIAFFVINYFIFSNFILLIVIIPSFFTGLNSRFIAYIGIPFFGLIFGVVCSWILERVAKKDHVIILGGVFTPFAAAINIYFILNIFNKTFRYIEMPETMTGSMIYVQEVITAEIAVILYLFFYNLPFLFLFYRKKQREYKVMLWYAFAVPVYVFLVPEISRWMMASALT